MDFVVQPWLVKLNIFAMKLAWKFGLYHFAGTSYARFWRQLMGEPHWSANLSQLPAPVSFETKAITGIKDNTRFKEDAVAVFKASAASLVMHDQKVKDEFLHCFIRDEAEYDMLATVISKIAVDVSFLHEDEYRKAMKSMRTMDVMNFEYCAAEKDNVFEHLVALSKAAEVFFTQDGIDLVVKEMIETEQEEFASTIYELKKGWKQQDFEQAGKAYGKVMGMMMGEKYE